MTYFVNHANTTTPPYTVYDNTTNTETSLKFPGRYVAGYGQAVAENFLHLLENFASDSEPSSPQIGQLWYDTAKGYLRVHSGSGSTVDARWKAASGIEYNAENPGPAVIGQLWVDTINRQLKIYTGSSWMVVGPDISTRDGLKNGSIVEEIMDVSNALHSVVTVYLSNIPIAIISKDTFYPKSGISGYSRINSGVNLNNPLSAIDKANFSGGVPTFTGTATSATQLIIDNVAVNSSKFMRTDIINNTEHEIHIKNNNGVVIGTAGNLNISYSENSNLARIYNTSSGSIALQTQINGSPKTILKVTGNKVGINTENPTADLEITGDVIISGKLTIKGGNGIGLDVTGKVTKGAIVDQTQVDAVQSTDQIAIYRSGDYLSKTTIEKLLAGVQGGGGGTPLTAASATVLGGVIVPAASTSGININTNGTIGLATASATQRGVVIVPAVATSGISNLNGTIGLATASVTQLGGVKIPEVATSGINNTAGIIGLATASTTQLGGVKVDGSTITIANGVISSTGGAGVASTTDLGLVKVDGSTITITDGVISSAGGGGGGVLPRTTKSATTTSIAAGASANLRISGFKGYALYKVQVSGPAWVRIYTSVAARTADATRLQTSDPSTPGVIAEVITTVANTVVIAPGVFGYNDEPTPTSNIELAVTNTGLVAAAITVTLTLVQLES